MRQQLQPKTVFVGTLESAGALTYLQGISKGLWIKGKVGHVLWNVLGIHIYLKSVSYLLPNWPQVNPILNHLHVHPKVPFQL